MKRSIASFLLGCCWLSAHGELQLQALHTTAAGNPATSLVPGSDGNFYGTLSNSVFRLTPSGTFSTLGSVPLLQPGLALAQDGNLYGVSRSGPLGNGAIFRVTPPAQITYVYSFGASDGKPLGLRAGLDGFLYGACLTTNGSPASDVWSVFQFDTNGVTTVLRLITNSTGSPTADFTLPVEGPDGALYGSISGVEFMPFGFARIAFYRLSGSGTYQILTNITSEARASSSDLVFGSDGWLYGVMGTERYPTADGSVFKLSTSGVFHTLFQFGSTTGSVPEARLLPAGDGALYGTTYSGGTSNSGTVFRITTNGAFTSLISFAGGTSSHPLAPLIEADDGNIYGTTGGATVPSTGIIFRLVETPVISGLTLTNGAATLTWNSFSNGVYRVDYKSGVSGATWLTLIPGITATDVTTSASDNFPAADQRFYRVVLLP